MGLCPTSLLQRSHDGSNRDREIIHLLEAMTFAGSRSIAMNPEAMKSGCAADFVEREQTGKKAVHPFRDSQLEEQRQICETRVFPDSRIQDFARVRSASKYDESFPLNELHREQARGFEPLTSSLGSWHSTTELRLPMREV